MSVSYDNLWKMLIDRHITKVDLRRMTGISPNTMTKLNKNEPVAMSIIERICKTLEVSISDVVEFTNDSEGRNV